MTTVGVCASVFGDRPVDELPGLLGDLTVTLTDLPTDSTLRCAPTPAQIADDAWTATFARQLKDRGIAVGCVSNSRDTQLLLGPHGRHTDPVCSGSEATKRDHARRHADASIELAVALGAPDVRLYFGSGDYAVWLDWRGSGVSTQSNVHNLVEVLEPYAERCAAQGVRLLLEPHPRQAVYDPPTMRLLCGELGDRHPNVGFCLDVANIAALGWEPVPAVRGWGPRLMAVHVKDLERSQGDVSHADAGWSRYGPQPPIRFRSLGRGQLPWDDIITALVEERFEGPMYIEHEDVLVPREAGISHALEQLSRLVPGRRAEGRTW